MAHTTPVVEDGATRDDDRWYEDDHEQLPPRPRRRLLAPVPLALFGVLLVAVGFIGGVEVQKREGGGGSSELPAGLQAALNGGRAAGQSGDQAGGAGGAQSSSSSTSGEVASVDGDVLYVTDSDGATVKVKVPKSATVTRNAKSSASAIHPGDTVVVQGSANDAGTMTAGSVSATASGVTSVSPFGVGGGGGQSGGGGDSGQSGSSQGDDVNSLFGG